MRSRAWALGLLLGLAGAAVAGDAHGFGFPHPPPPDWVQEIANAFQGGPIQVTRIHPDRGAHDQLLHPLAPSSCAEIPAVDPWAITLDVRFEPKRTYRMTVLVGELAEGVDGYGLVLRAEERSARCTPPKSGNSMLQVGRVWMTFPSVCRTIYEHDHALPLAIAALRDKLGARVAKGFILAGCGTTAGQGLTDVAAYLAAPNKALLRGKKPVQSSTDGE
jgi:hypothetical protein